MADTKTDTKWSELVSNFSLWYVKLPLQTGANVRYFLRDGEQIQPPQPIYGSETCILGPFLLDQPHSQPFASIVESRSFRLWPDDRGFLHAIPGFVHSRLSAALVSSGQS